MQWFNFAIVIIGGGTLAYVSYISLQQVKKDDVNPQPGILYDTLNIFGWGSLTSKGHPLHGIDQGVTEFYHDMGQGVADLFSGLGSGYASNFFDNPTVVPIAVLAASLFVGIVFFT